MADNWFVNNCTGTVTTKSNDIGKEQIAILYSKRATWVDIIENGTTEEFLFQNGKCTHLHKEK